MKSKFRFNLTVILFSFSFFASFQAKGQYDLDCSKLDMSKVVEYFNDAFPMQLTSYFTSLKRLEDCIQKDVYAAKESNELVDRQIYLIGTEGQLVEIFLYTGIVKEMKIEKYHKDLIAAVEGLKDYGKSLKALIKEKNEETTKNVVAARKKSWGFIFLISTVATEEK